MSDAWKNLGAGGAASELRSQLDAKGKHMVDKGSSVPPKGGDSKFGPDVVPPPSITKDSPGV